MKNLRDPKLLEYAENRVAGSPLRVNRKTAELLEEAEKKAAEQTEKILNESFYAG